MPKALAEEALKDPANVPFILRDCKGTTCAFYQYVQGTSMASPHAAETATQTPCPSPPTFAYPDDRDPSFDGDCEGTLARNGIYGRGIVNALTAVLD